MRRRPATSRRRSPSCARFHRQLCATRVLDPACGTGNFLYVSLELMKKLEGEVLEALAQLGEPESMGLDRETVDPHQFLGLELNPRAAAIAELVVWIGYLQQHYRNRTGHPSEPILRAFENINFGKRQGYDAVLTWDGYPVPQVVEKDGRRIETYPNARRPEWPEAEFIVGNPPFIGGKDLRARLGDAYTRGALGRAQAHERQRRFRHVLVGPRGGDPDGERLAPAPLRLRHHQLDHAGILTPRDEEAHGGEDARLARDGDPGSSVDEGGSGFGGGADCDDGGDEG